MTTDILIQFLSAGLIDVGGDDAKLEKLQSTSADLAAVLKKTPSKSSSFALIAFDPTPPEDDPVIKEAEAALQKRWATYVNTFSSTPITVIRAVLLDALSKAAIENDYIGIAFVSAARNALPFMESGNESEIWAGVVISIERQVNTRAEAEWATPESINVPDLDYSAPKAIKIQSREVNIDKDKLTERIAAAGGPTNAAGVATGGNSLMPNSNQGWVNQFTPLMSSAISEVLEEVLEEGKITPVDLSEPLKSLAHAVSIYITGTMKAVTGATAGLQRRTNLIWWKETLYSPSVQVSYRDVEPSIAATLMAFDLHQQIPTFSPASVAAFLNETVLSLPTVKVDEMKSIRDLVGEALKAAELSPLRDVATQLIPNATGRGPILGILATGLTHSINDEDFLAQVGIPADTVLSVSQWATWVFRELQAARALKEAGVPKIRARKAK
jgi:hypothetical protein